MDNAPDKEALPEACRMRWKKARGYPMSDEARHSLAVRLDGILLEPADISIWDEDRGPENGSVPLEFLFPGAPDCDGQRLGEALGEEEQRAEFRWQLKQRQESSLRRRKANAAEEGDTSEECNTSEN
eukprot:g18733.t1